MVRISQMKLVPANADQMEKILKDINLNEDQHRADTLALKEWLQTQPHLPHDLDDRMLAGFLVGCKNSLERAKQILDTYLTNRTTCPDFYQARDPCEPTFRRLARLVQYFVLPKMTPEGYRVSVFCMQSADVSSSDFNLRLNAIKVLSSYDVRLLEETYWAGDIIVINCKHVGLRHLQSIATLPLLKKYIHCVNESLPVRYKRIIFINLSSVVEPVISMTKRILKQKFVQRHTMGCAKSHKNGFNLVVCEPNKNKDITKKTITTTQDHHFLYKHIPQDILPDEYGGEAGPIDDLNDSWQLKVESYQDWFLKDMTRKVNESKRPEKSNSKPKQLPVFGTEGSFRKLTLD